jgi:hypothetical protein
MVIGRVHEVSAALASAGSSIAMGLLNAIDALIAPVGSSVDPLESFREVLVIADHAPLRVPRRLWALALVVGLVAGSVAWAILATYTSLPGR